MLYSIKLFLITILFFSGCSAISEPSVKKGHEKSFEYEDVYIMTGLYLEELQDYNSSSKMLRLSSLKQIKRVSLSFTKK